MTEDDQIRLEDLTLGDSETYREGVKECIADSTRHGDIFYKFGIRDHYSFFTTSQPRELYDLMAAQERYEFETDRFPDPGKEVNVLDKETGIWFAFRGDVDSGNLETAFETACENYSSYLRFREGYNPDDVLDPKTRSKCAAESVLALMDLLEENSIAYWLPYSISVAKQNEFDYGGMVVFNPSQD